VPEWHKKGGKMQIIHHKLRKIGKLMRHVLVPSRVKVALESFLLKKEVSNCINELTHCFKKDFNAPTPVRSVCSSYDFKNKLNQKKGFN